MGPGGGNEARTSCSKLSFEFHKEKPTTYEWRSEIFHANTPCSSRSVQNIFHKTISFNPETQSRAIGQTDDPKRRRNVG